MNFPSLLHFREITKTKAEIYAAATHKIAARLCALSALLLSHSLCSDSLTVQLSE